MEPFERQLGDLPDPLPIPILRDPFEVTVQPPGSKSITNRAYILAALADGPSRLEHPLRSDDTDRLLAALETLGTRVERHDDHVIVHGNDGRFPRGGAVNLGDGGTPTRFLLAASCLAAEPVTIDGSPRMRERPVAEGVGLLRSLGADIDYLETAGQLPIVVRPSDDLVGGHLVVGRTASSQFISALLLIAPWLERGIDLSLREPTSESYIELTIWILRRWEAAIRGGADTAGRRSISIAGQALRGREFAIEPDASSATYFAAAASMVPGSVVHLPGLGGAPQPDLECCHVFGELGADVRQADGTLTVRYLEPLAPRHELDMSLMPDATMTMAVAAATGRSPLTLTGLETLRVKETDRIAAIATELRKVGCEVEIVGDSVTIIPPPRHERPVTVETYNDHRMAMAFGVLGLVRPNISVANPACVGKSYPGYWHDLARLYTYHA